jgi:hypothetical protein
MTLSIETLGGSTSKPTACREATRRLDAPALRNAWRCAGIGRSARQQEHALKHGLYTREAIEERWQLRALMRHRAC